MELKSNIKRSLVGLFLLILSAYNINSTMFYHQHIVNGVIVNHSHFHSNLHTDSSDDGGHSIDVIKLIAVLNNFALEEQNLNSHIEIPQLPFERYLLTAPVLEASCSLKSCRSLRAPPALVIA